MFDFILGSIKRVTAATAMNNVSSRSHAIFTLFVEGTLKDDVLADENNKLDNIFSKFHLVDLAGSERAKKTQATGGRFKEGVAINLGMIPKILRLVVRTRNLKLMF